MNFGRPERRPAHDAGTGIDMAITGGRGPMSASDI
jgi:hypothetical protein